MALDMPKRSLASASKTAATTAPTSVAAYLASVPPLQRRLLKELRQTIHAVLPDVEECIHYAMPSFRCGTHYVAGFLATKRGCSYYPHSGRTLTTLANEIAGYSHTKSALHFSEDVPLPAALVRKLLRARLAEAKTRANALKYRHISFPTEPRVDLADLVLVDAPCSGMGTLRRNPDLKWRQTPESIDELKVKQASILAAAASLLKPGGRLVYATCSFLPEENQNIINDFLQTHAQFALLDCSELLMQQHIMLNTGQFLQLSPTEHRTDGFFAAALTRIS